MGWASGGDIFDSVATSLIKANASDTVKTSVLGDLIDQLRSEDWGTESESLDVFRDDPIIIALFRDRGITTKCEEASADAARCARKLGHLGDHVDENDNSWPPSP